MLSVSSDSGEKGHLATLSHTRSWSLKVNNLCLLNSNKKAFCKLDIFSQQYNLRYALRMTLLCWPTLPVRHTHTHTSTHTIYLYLLSGQVNLWSLISNSGVSLTEATALIRVTSESDVCVSATPGKLFDGNRFSAGRGMCVCVWVRGNGEDKVGDQCYDSSFSAGGSHTCL